MRRVTDDERRARLGLRHHLSDDARAASPVDVARDLVGLHATDPTTIFIAAAARTRAPDVAGMERALYDERSLVRMLGMRRTLFVVPFELVGVVHAACTQAIAVNERRRLVALLEEAGIAADGKRWDGRVVGGWCQRKDGEIAWRLLEDVGSDAHAAIEACAERLKDWLGDVRVIPRFRTPLERELAGG